MKGKNNEIPGNHQYNGMVCHVPHIAECVQIFNFMIYLIKAPFRARKVESSEAFLKCFKSLPCIVLGKHSLADKDGNT